MSTGVLDKAVQDKMAALEKEGKELATTFTSLKAQRDALDKQMQACTGRAADIAAQLTVLKELQEAKE